jgi:hypothetical protein
VRLNLQSVFNGAFPNIDINRVSKQVFDMHQREIQLWEACGMQFCIGNQMDVVSSYTPMNPSCNISQSKITPLGTTKRVVQSQHWFGTT